MDPQELEDYIASFKIDPRYPLDGTFEALALTKLLESHGIGCCVVGRQAQKYFGAGIIRDFWELCVPSPLLGKAVEILTSNQNSETYETTPPPQPEPESISHTYPCFRVKKKEFRFTLLTSEECHLECIPSNIERSYHAVPYAKLTSFVQSLLDSDRVLDLTYVIDGMDLSQEWGEENLNLDGTTDCIWAESRNEMIKAQMPNEDEHLFRLRRIRAKKKTELWHEIVSTKKKRIDLGAPIEVCLTQFRGHKDGDPRETLKGLF